VVRGRDWPSGRGKLSEWLSRNDGVGDDEAKNALFVEAFKTAGLKDCAGVSTSTPVNASRRSIVIQHDTTAHVYMLRPCTG
jgi:hypothetical protein